MFRGKLYLFAPSEKNLDVKIIKKCHSCDLKKIIFQSKGPATQKIYEFTWAKQDPKCSMQLR